MQKHKNIHHYKSIKNFTFGMDKKILTNHELTIDNHEKNHN